MFSIIKSLVQQQFKKMVDSGSPLFYVNINREEIWSAYLDGFAPEDRQANNCNSCKSFFRQYGGIVTIGENNTLNSIWDLPEVNIEGEFGNSILAVKRYVHSLPVADVFRNPFPKLGTDKNVDKAKDMFWSHYYLELPATYVHKAAKPSIDTVLAGHRDNQSVLKRSLDEITIDSCQTVLELIGQNSLYRGKEFEGLVKGFHDLAKTYKKVPTELKNNFCWKQSQVASQAVCKIKNSSIGKLLSDISEGIELDKAVNSFEAMVAPTNYKRPTPVVTPGMIKAAQARIMELGYSDSLVRKYATSTDLDINNLLFVDKSSELSNIFEEMEKEISVNPKTFSKMEEIPIESFIKDVVPHTKSIELLVENTHLANFVSLVTSENKDAKSLFKWNNPFSWAYTGGITDSIKERVKTAGGKVDGEVRVSLSWYNHDDLDLHVIEPNKNEIYYVAKQSRTTSGRLDVDMNAGVGTTRTPVENIAWDANKILEGVYEVNVNNFNKREHTNSGFVVQIECRGEVTEFSFDDSPPTSRTKKVVSFTYTKKDGVVFAGNVKTSTSTKEKWNISTNKFHKVKNVLLSPNHWETPIGNKHYLFTLENCVSDEETRPFFNEFIKEELLKEKRVFEVLGSKVKVAPSTNQLSGIGFSDTKKGHVIARVKGAFTRTLKVVI